MLPIVGPDYFNVPASNDVYNRGPISNLTDSPSYPSGHTTYGYMGSILLAVLVPDRYRQMIARAAEYGNDRILMGAHYAMDVLGGRTLATYDLAHLLANDPTYLGQTVKDYAAPMAMGQPRSDIPPVTDYRAAVKAAQAELARRSQAGCGDAVRPAPAPTSAASADPGRDDAFYGHDADLRPAGRPSRDGRQDRGRRQARARGRLPPDRRLPEPDAASRPTQILTETEGPGGGFLDDGSAFGVYSRLNL